MKHNKVLAHLYGFNCLSRTTQGLNFNQRAKDHLRHLGIHLFNTSNCYIKTNASSKCYRNKNSLKAKSVISTVWVKQKLKIENEFKHSSIQERERESLFLS